MQSYREGFTPFPYANLLSPIDETKDNNKYFSTCTHLASYTTSVYIGCSTTSHVHPDLCQKMKISVRFPCHDRRSIILCLPYTGNVQTRPFSSILKSINGSILSYGKGEKEFNFERKVTMEKLFTSYWVYSPLSYKSKHNVQPPRSSLIDWEPHCFSFMRFPWVEDWSGGNPVGRNLVSQFRTMPTQNSVIFSLLLIIY
jgi:hypothetical protein